ncbi:MAG: hypothetical protein IKN29_00995 [Bacteroidales bacterium]|nr:hypothetical protein [Bacteroidales bacterium]
MSNDDHTLETLKRLVCEGAGVAAHTPGDFYTIMAFVEGRTHEGIGLTTVKRLWQYGGLSSKPRQATLDVLAHSIGYRSYDDFATHYGRGGESSNIVLGGGQGQQPLPRRTAHAALESRARNRGGIPRQPDLPHRQERGQQIPRFHARTGILSSIRTTNTPFAAN